MDKTKIDVVYKNHQAPRLRLKRLPTLIKFIFILMKIKKVNN